MGKIGIVWLSLCIGLVGCVTEKLPPVSVYTLSPDLTDVAPAGGSQHEDVILKLDRIRSSRSLRDTTMLYSDAQFGQNSYAYSRWSDAPPAMLLAVFQQAIEDSGKYRAVVPHTSDSQFDLLLESTLLEFSHRLHADGTSDGVIRIRCYLLDSRTRRITASHEFASSVPASSRDARGAATALNKAAANVSRALVDWLE
jgi:cholesterol transport system auxiliary component